MGHKKDRKHNSEAKKDAYRKDSAEVTARYGMDWNVYDAPHSPFVDEPTVCPGTKIKEDELRRLAGMWAFEAALERYAGDMDIALYVADCDIVTELLDNGEYPEAIITAAWLADKLAAGEEIDEDEDEEEWVENPEYY